MPQVCNICKVEKRNCEFRKKRAGGLRSGCKSCEKMLKRGPNKNIRWSK